MFVTVFPQEATRIIKHVARNTFIELIESLKKCSSGQTHMKIHPGWSTLSYSKQAVSDAAGGGIDLKVRVSRTGDEAGH